MSRTSGRGEMEPADPRDGSDVAAGSSRQQHLNSTMELPDVETTGSQTDNRSQLYENSVEGHDDPTPTGIPSSDHQSPQTRSGPGISNEDDDATPTGIPNSDHKSRQTRSGPEISNEDDDATPTGIPNSDHQSPQTSSGPGISKEDVARKGIEENQSTRESIDYTTNWLDLSRAVIEARRTKDLARALESNRLKNVKTLYLHNNAADLGVRAALNAMQEGYLGKLEKLILWNVSSYDQITTAEEGTDTIGHAIGENKTPELQTLDVTSSLQKLTTPRLFSEVWNDLTNLSLGTGRLKRCANFCFRCSWVTSGNCSTLECLNCQVCKSSVYTGNDGLKKIVRGLAMSRPPLKVLILRDNYIGDDGVKFLAKYLKSGDLPTLDEVDLQNNDVHLEGAREIVSAYVENPLLTAIVLLDWPDPILKERASAFREKNIRLEHRLADLQGINMEHGRISKTYNWKPDFTLVKPSTKKHYWLRILCQHPHHEHTSSQDKGNPTQLEGIEVRKKPIFRTSNKVLATEYEAQVSQTDNKSKSRMYITVGSSLLLQEAKRNLDQAPEDKNFWNTGKLVSSIQAPKDQKKNERVVKAVIMELLIVADRKPRYFQEVFGLTRVLLKDEVGVHYPSYVCVNCTSNSSTALETVVEPQFLQKTLIPKS